MDALLSRYNDGRRKTLYCLAVNPLEPDDLKGDLRETESNPEPAALAPKERVEVLEDRVITLEAGSQTGNCGKNSGLSGGRSKPGKTVPASRYLLPHDGFTRFFPFTNT